MNHAELQQTRDGRWYPSDISMGKVPRISDLSKRSPVLPILRSHSKAVETIADDPAKVSLAGRLISQATAGSHVRFERVAALQQGLAAGTYRVASSDLADKLIAEMREKL